MEQNNGGGVVSYSKLDPSGGKGIDVMTKKAEMPIHPESLKLDARAIMAGQVGMIGGRPLSTSTLRGKGRCSIDSSLVFQ